MPGMRFSIWPSPARPWDEILQLASHCEQTGWDGGYFADHFMPNGPGPAPLDGNVLECWSVIAALAASVPRLRLGSLVTSVTYRHPAVLANIAAAVDQVSHRRPPLGVGGGRAAERACRVRHRAGLAARADGPVRGGRADPALAAARAPDHVLRE